MNDIFCHGAASSASPATAAGAKCERNKSGDYQSEE
jgi:hypothetical protein